VFTYLDPTVRQRLIAQGVLRRIDRSGNLLDPSLAPPDGEVATNILGPIPLPIHVGDSAATVDWYAAVRSTELT